MISHICILILGYPFDSERRAKTHNGHRRRRPSVRRREPYPQLIAQHIDCTPTDNNFSMGVPTVRGKGKQ